MLSFRISSHPLFIAVNLLSLQACENITGVTMSNDQWDSFLLMIALDSGIQHLRGLKKLNHLNISNIKITDNGIKHLQGISSHHEICLWSLLMITSALGLTSLITLNLSNTKITFNGVSHLSSLVSLLSLSLKGCEQVNDRSIEFLNGMRTEWNLRKHPVYEFTNIYV